MFQTIIDVPDLADQLANSEWVIIDCRFQLGNPTVGYDAYLAAHIPGAVYAHLDDDLSGPPVTDAGRHPLPTPEALTQAFGRWGIRTDSQVIIYDDARGMIASRLWWMLNYMGHRHAAVLNGGWQAWQKAGQPTKAGLEENESTTFTGHPNASTFITIDDVLQQPLLIDSRSADRYRGENETRDPIGGHIPGAISFHFANNFDASGRFLPPEILRQQFNDLFQQTPPENATFYCGSGVSACVNLLAATHAGLGQSKLYVGSWSEWCRAEGRPLVTRDQS